VSKYTETEARAFCGRLVETGLLAPDDFEDHVALMQRTRSRPSVLDRIRDLFDRLAGAEYRVRIRY
jgi:hypothetical protein